MARRCLLLLVLLGVLAHRAPGQSARQVGAGFERDINRYRWTSDALFRKHSDRWHAIVTNTYLSEAFLSAGRLSDFRDEQRGAWDLGWALGGSATALVHGGMRWYSLSNAIAAESYGGLRLDPSPYLTFTPSIGVALDRRPGPTEPDGSIPLRTDTGPAFDLRTVWQPEPISEYRITWESETNWQLITPRQAWTLRNRAGLARDFNRTSIVVESGYANVRRDTYQAASFLNRTEPATTTAETIEATTSDTLETALRIARPVRGNWRTGAELRFSNHRRFIRTLRAPADALFFDTDFNRQVADAEVTVGRMRGTEELRINVQAGVTVERRQLANRARLPPNQAALKGDLLRRADFDRTYLTLRASWQTTPSDRVSLSLAGSANIVRRDTPEQNTDDRDEVFHNAEVGLLLWLNRYLETDLRLVGTYYHTVYLKADRSGENNTQRALRLLPGVRWSPGAGTQVRFRSELRATYTVDDFDIPGRTRNDQSARERRYALDVDQRLGDRAQLRLDATVSDLHLGRLLWDRFAEIPFDTLRTWSLWPRLTLGERPAAEIGARAFVRRDYNVRATVRYRSDDGPERTVVRPGREWIEQFGPTCAVAWPTPGGSVLRLEGWIQWQRLRQRLYGALPVEDEAAIRDAARRGRTRLVPNLSISVLWML